MSYNRGLEILAAMEKLKFDIRKAWLVLIEELVRNRFLEDANTVFLKGAKGELRATDKIYDLLIEEDCKAGDHSNALIIAYEMRLKGRMASTFHFNSLLSVKVIELGGTPTIGDCAMILHAAIRAHLPLAFSSISQTAQDLGYIFGSPLYDEVILLCIELGEVDAAIAVVADMETTGIKVPDETLDKVLAARQSGDLTTEETFDEK